MTNPGAPPSAAGLPADLHDVAAVTLDLDDTLWPIAPLIERAESAMHDWLRQHAPAVTARYDIEAMRGLRESVAQQRPEYAHDFTWLRRHSIGVALRECGADPSLADGAFEAFFAARNAVELYEEVDDALARLASRFPLLALTNGNADLARTGIARHFRGVVSARLCGVAKPDRRIFEVACAQLGVTAPQVLHVGDDWLLDVQGARQAGLRVAWLSRSPVPHDHPSRDDGTWTVAHLGEVADALHA